MPDDRASHESRFHAHCCPSCLPSAANPAVTRRQFLGTTSTALLGGIALAKLSWPALAGTNAQELLPTGRRALRVKPVLVYSIPTRRPQTSWRSWGGIQTPADVDTEVSRINTELKALHKQADFPVEFLPITRARSAQELEGAADLDKADVFIVYAAGGWMNTFDALHKHGKDMIFFCRHKSGPVYLWYEIISPRYLRQHTDSPAVPGVTDEDVVIDSQDELLWRLRALCGLHNTLGTRMLAIGGPGAWSQPPGVVPELVRDKWRFDIQTVSYDELGELIKQARADASAVQRAQQHAAAYLDAPGNTLETERPFVENAFLLDEIFRTLMKKADCRAITINECMGTIMPLAETSACLTLSTLNDAGYLAFCESDFVVIPSGVLLANISGKPAFLNDPTYPHDGIITLAHCTAPRRMNGRELEPARIMTHFESDYGAAPKVEMRTGQTVTNIVPDFAAQRWVGLRGEIIDAPFMPICRSQIDISFTCDSQKLAERMPGFHWMTAYGDYLRETGYALKRVGIEWDTLT
ncbi:MAG: sugar isomerase [Planctomycetota bacterium]